MDTRAAAALSPRGSAAENPQRPKTAQPCPQPPGPAAVGRRAQAEEGAPTRVPASPQQARNILQPGHQKVFRKEVEYHLQGLVGLQGVLQVALLHHRQVFVL